MYLSISLFSDSFSEAFCENKNMYFRWKLERNNPFGYVAYEAILPTWFIDYSQMKALPGHWDVEVDKRFFFIFFLSVALVYSIDRQPRSKRPPRWFLQGGCGCQTVCTTRHSSATTRQTSDKVSSHFCLPAASTRYSRRGTAAAGIKVPFAETPARTEICRRQFSWVGMRTRDL